MRITAFTPAALALATALSLGTAHAAPVIDQNSPANNVHMASLSQSDIAQSFQQSASNISGAGFFTLANGASGTLTYSLYDSLGGNLLASATGAAAAGTWVDLFWNPVAITADTTYYLVVTGDSSIGLTGSTANPYSRGQVYANSGFGPFPAYDYTFRTYADDAFGVNNVPEPGSLALAGLALAGLTLARRRQGASA